jgi:hypothetical protein
MLVNASDPVPAKKLLTNFPVSTLKHHYTAAPPLATGAQFNHNGAGQISLEVM